MAGHCAFVFGVFNRLLIVTGLHHILNNMAWFIFDSIILLAERDDVLLACCHIERQGAAGYFGMFAVNPDLQMGGIGRALLAEAERVAHASWRVPAMRMTVIEQRAELIAWYERRGYALTGETLPFPYGDERCGLPRRDDLRFVCMSKPLGEVFA